MVGRVLRRRVVLRDEDLLEPRRAEHAALAVLEPGEQLAPEGLEVVLVEHVGDLRLAQRRVPPVQVAHVLVHLQVRDLEDLGLRHADVVVGAAVLRALLLQRLGADRLQRRHVRLDVHVRRVPAAVRPARAVHLRLQHLDRALPLDPLAHVPRLRVVAEPRVLEQRVEVAQDVPERRDVLARRVNLLAGAEDLQPRVQRVVHRDAPVRARREKLVQQAADLVEPSLRRRKLHDEPQRLRVRHRAPRRAPPTPADPARRRQLISNGPPRKSNSSGAPRKRGRKLGSPTGGKKENWTLNP